MNPHLIKEFRALLSPWSFAMATAILMPLANFLIAVQVIDDGVFVNFLSGLVVFVFFSSLLAIAASPFGTEFHYRTLPLLLSQPISRSLVWKHKLIAASTGIGVALLPVVFASLLVQLGAPAATVPGVAITRSITSTPQPTPSAGLSPEQEMYQRRYGINRPVIHSPPAIPSTPDVISPSEITFSACALFLPTLCSVTFWTLLARSTLGGMVFTVFSQLLVFGILRFVSERFGFANSHLGIRDISAQTPIFVLAGIIYCCIFLNLSWRKFSRLEVSQLLPGTLAGSKSLTATGFNLDGLRCRPVSGFLNLIRKEIQLQKPLIIIAGILLALWVLTYILLLLQPAHTNFAEFVFALTMGFYIPLTGLLSGCVSLGEEKNLNLPIWHLTLPIPIWRQWAAKLVVGLAAWLLLGLLLPFVLTRLGWGISHLRFLGQVDLNDWLKLALFMTGVFILSFWAMTMFSNTVRAVIASVAIVTLLCCSVALAFWLIESWLPEFLAVEHSKGYITSPITLLTMTLILALVQSLSQFRRIETPRSTIAKYSCTLAAVTFLEILAYLLQP
jgi:hypothetical protein